MKRNEITKYVQEELQNQTRHETIKNRALRRFGETARDEISRTIILHTSNTISAPQLAEYLMGADWEEDDLEPEFVAAKRNGLVIAFVDEDEVIRLTGAFTGVMIWRGEGLFWFEKREEKWRLSWDISGPNFVESRKNRETASSGEPIVWTLTTNLPYSDFVGRNFDGQLCRGFVFRASRLDQPPRKPTYNAEVRRYVVRQESAVSGKNWIFVRYYLKDGSCEGPDFSLSSDGIDSCFRKACRTKAEAFQLLHECKMRCLQEELERVSKEDCPEEGKFSEERRATFDVVPLRKMLAECSEFDDEETEEKMRILMAVLARD